LQIEKRHCFHGWAQRVASRSLLFARLGSLEPRALHLCAAGAALCVVAAFVPACDPGTTGAKNPSAEFGVFYGGQIQHLDRIPFELDAAKQTFGFRITFQRPLPTADVVHWEVNRPAKKGSGSTRQTELREDTVKAGSAKFEKVMHFEPGDPLGVWNVRVTLGQSILLDRPFEVYDAAAFERRIREVDGGGF
jgi:hypothetical protein